MNIRRILIIGGDVRCDELLKALTESGYTVEKFTAKEPLLRAVSRCDAVILGVPASRDDKTVDAPYLEEPVLLKDLFKMIGRDKLLLAGKMSESMKAVADIFQVKWVDYASRDDFEILNAVPTCEGAIALCMEEMPITVFGCNALVTGYGKIGQLLSKYLKMLGARVTVCARKSEARAKARIDGMETTDFQNLSEKLRNTDVCFNTVPSLVLDTKELQSARDTLIIDLASKPGGVNVEMAGSLGIKLLWALGLPGKVAPISAGNIMKEIICNIFSELGE